MFRDAPCGLLASDCDSCSPSTTTPLPERPPRRATGARREGRTRGCRPRGSPDDRVHGSGGGLRHRPGPSRVRGGVGLQGWWCGRAEDDAGSSAPGAHAGHDRPPLRPAWATSRPPPGFPRAHARAGNLVASNSRSWPSISPSEISTTRTARSRQSGE